MRYIFVIVCVWSLFAATSHGEDGPTLLKAMGTGSLSGKVIDAKTKKPVSNAVIFLKAPKGVYFPVHEEDKKRPNLIVQIPPSGAFKSPIFLHYPYYLDGLKKVPTGETFVLKGDSQQEHVIEIGGRPAITTLVRAGREVELTLSPMLLAKPMQSNVYSETRAYVYVFDHPYHAITGSDGTFTMPRAPAGVEVTVMAWHEEVGWLLTKAGKSHKFEAGKNSLEIERKE